jgi:glycosyltransferase involved in cell wall biosynthesis
MTGLCIAHVLSSFGLGGQERLALDLAGWQRRRGDRVFAVSLAEGPEGPLAEQFLEQGVTAISVAKTSGLDATLPFRLASLFTRERVDIVHTHNPHALIYGAPAAGMARAAAVHTKHGMNPDLPRRIWLRRRASTLVDAYVAVTPRLARAALETKECEAARLHVISNGVDTERFAPNPEARRRVRAELGIPQDAWVVGTVGRLAPEKDQTLLVRAMAPLLDERRQLVILGDGPERGAVEASIAATCRPEFCHLLGSKPDVERYLVAFDAFALSSKTEGLPLSMLEAMAAGVPVISTAVGGIPDVLQTGVTGLLVPPGDQQALFRQLLFLVNYPTAALRIGTRGRDLVRADFSLAGMAERYHGVYGSVVRRVATRDRRAVRSHAP